MGSRVTATPSTPGPRVPGCSSLPNTQIRTTGSRAGNYANQEPTWGSLFSKNDLNTWGVFLVTGSHPDTRQSTGDRKQPVEMGRDRVLLTPPCPYHRCLYPHMTAPRTMLAPGRGWGKELQSEPGSVPQFPHLCNGRNTIILIELLWDPCQEHVGIQPLSFLLCVEKCMRKEPVTLKELRLQLKLLVGLSPERCVYVCTCRHIPHFNQGAQK